MKSIYCFPATYDRERLDYAKEIAAIERSLRNASTLGPATLDVLEFRSRDDLRPALLRASYNFVVVAGHGPGFGLFEVANERQRERHVGLFARQLLRECDPNLSVLLMGCWSSWLASALARHHLRGVSFAAPLSAGAARAFLSGFFDAVAAGRDPKSASETGQIAMAYEYPEAADAARWFEPEILPQPDRSPWSADLWTVPGQERDDVRGA